MPIQSENIKFRASVVMDDVPEGGGRASSRVIADGVSNEIFPDISEADRAGGRVRLRKLFLGIDTPDTEKLLGANVIVARRPADPNVDVTLYSSGDGFDQRAEVATRLAAYLGPAGEWYGYLFENHVLNQQMIQLAQRPTAPLPTVGRTLSLIRNEGAPNEIRQDVRITRVTAENRIYTTASGGDFPLVIVNCELQSRLTHDFPGSPPSRLYARASGSTLVRDTRVTDAARYYGAQPLALAAEPGDSTVRVASIYSRLVPSSETESPLIDQMYATQFAHTLATTPREVVVAGSPLSVRIKIGQENRGYNYTTILKPLPAPGSVLVVYRSGGNTYILRDNGAGVLEGAGSGTINYLTGSVLATLEAYPDAGSAVVIYYGPNRAYTNRSGQATFRPPAVRITLDHQHIAPGTFSVSWSSGGQTKTLTDNGFGQLIGDGEGIIIYAVGEVWFRPAAFPDGGSQYAIDYDHSPIVEEAFPGLTPDAAGFVQFTLGDTAVPGSLELEWAVSRQTSISSGASSSAASTARNAATETISLPAPGITYETFYVDGAAAANWS